MPSITSNGMKLLMISGDRSLAGGKRGAFYNTLGELHKYWDRVDIVCPQVKSGELRVESLFGNVYIHPSPWPLIFQPLWILKEGIKIYKENKFDLITVHEYPPFYNGIGARLLWRKIKVPYVLEIHHIPGYPRSGNLKEVFYKNLSRVFIKFDSLKAKGVRVVNQHQVPDFLIESGVPKNKIVYIPSMYINLDTFKPLNLKKEYGIIFIGRLEDNKGADLLIEAVSKLKVENEKLKVVIVGIGSLLESLKSKVKSLKLENNIIFHGWAKDQNEVAKLFNQSKILVMLSYNEGGPRVVLEAMACGVPVIATKVGLVPDIIKDGESGNIVRWEPAEIAGKIKDLISDSEKYGKYRKNGIEIANKFEKQEMVKNYAEKLKSLL